MTSARGSRTRLVVTGSAIAAVVALIAGIAVVSGGYNSRRMDLGDASVWVASERYHSVGRANTAVLELNSVVETGGRQPELVQRGSTVLVLDPDRASVDVVDPATSTVVDTVAVPPEVDTLALAGSRVVLAAGGDVWTSPVEEFGDFDGDEDPDLSFGAGSVVAVDDDGRLFAFTPSTGQVAEVGAGGGDRVSETWQLEGLDPSNRYSITSAGGRWAVLDEDERVLRTASLRVPLDGAIGDGARLQRPAASGDAIAVAHRGGLVEVALDDGSVEPVVTGRAGAPAAPMRHAGCLHAVWADGAVWQRCDGRPATLDGLPDPAPSPELAFLANGDALVVNDARSGRSWAVADGYRVIDNWDALLDRTSDDETVEQNDPDTPPSLERTQVPPVAVDDEFGARPGRTTTLPVLLNDYDANGDVLVVDAIVGAPEHVQLDIVSNGQELQLRLPPEASGTLSFGYTVTDGRGGTAEANVLVTVRGDDENAPPMPTRATRGDVAAGGRVALDVLGDWIDPDGDPVFLASAEVDGDDLVSATPEGRLVFTENGGPGQTRTVRLLVSDGRDTGSGSVEIAVRAPGSVPLVAEPFVVTATAGEEVRVEPLRHVRGGTEELRLSAVPSRPEASITADFDGGTFRFRSQIARTHLLEYTVTDGAQTATGTVRVEVTVPPEHDTVPITVPHTAFLRVGQPADVDVLATDIDPTGGVLLVTGLPEEAGGADPRVRVEVIEHRILRISLSGPLEHGSATVRYRVSNGLAEADGEVAVVQVPDPVRSQPIAAAPDTASVRVGGVVEIPVLANDSHPDGERLILAPDLAEEPESGLLFAAGDVLRFAAPDRPGEVEAVYRVEDAHGQFATATVRIAVREEDAATNVAPVPATVQGRVLAGETVRIRIPLSGIDPDGDSVQFLGQDSNPERGAVVAVGPDWIDYTAGEYSAGTDAFGYTVVDALGARATGVVRVGIAPRMDGARTPVAVEDHITVRPGRTVVVRVLDNDSDPDGGRLTITGVEPTVDGAVAEHDGEVIRVTVPEATGDYGFLYTIVNEQQAEASSFLAVDVREDAPPARPEASDTVLSLTDVLGSDSLDVDVLRNVFYAEGEVRDLEVSLVDGFRDGAELRPGGRIRVDVGDRRRVIPFAVRHPDDPDQVAHALIWVPGRADALPQLRDDARRVRVESGEEVRIRLNDHVVAASGRPVRLADRATVRATRSDGAELVVDDATLRFRSEPGYFGTASISFTVTDGADANDPEGRTATLVIPIEVTPAENQPPSLSGGVIEFEQGQSRTLDLLKLTNYPYPDDLDQLRYRLLDPRPSGFDFALDGSELRITAQPSSAVGTRGAIAVGVADGNGDGRGGRIELRVLASTRPLARPAPDSAVVERGRTTVVDVLANDRATNPFPGTPLEVVGIAGLEQGSLPDGIEVEPSEDRSRLTVTVSPDAEPVNSTLRYQVADATGDPGRYAWGTVTISVQDRPDPVTEARLTGFGDRSLELAWGAGAANNSAITGFEIALHDAAGAEVDRSVCEATNCRVATLGNGRDHAVRATIAARNGIGLSDPIAIDGLVWSDVVPAAPAGLRAAPLDGGLRLSWTPVDTGPGSAVGSYVVTVAGTQDQVGAGAVCTSSVCTLDWGGLANGSLVAFTVSARNQAYPALSRWAESSGTGTPFGAPASGGITVDADAGEGSATVSWSPFSANGDPIRGYFVQRLRGDATRPPGGPQACTVSSPAPGEVVRPAGGGSVVEMVEMPADATSAVFSGLGNPTERYTFVVWGWNRAGCVATEVASVVVRPTPPPVAEVRSEMRWRNGGTVWDRYVSGLSSSYSRIEMVAVDARGAELGQAKSFAAPGWPRELLDRPFGEAVRFKVRQCAPWGTCGPWSSVLPPNASASITFVVPGRSWDAATGTWSWTGDPANGMPVAYRCGAEGDPVGVAAQTPTSCTVAAAVPPAPAEGEAPSAPWTAPKVWLDVEIGGIVARYER